MTQHTAYLSEDPIHTFARGVHPPEGKDLARLKEIEVLPVPEEVHLALLQHIGAPLNGVLKARDTVTAGQLVGESPAFVSAALHASLPGTITRPLMVTLPNGRHVPATGIKTDRTEWDSDPEGYKARLKENFLSVPENALFTALNTPPNEILTAIRAAGLVGQGGAAFPTHVKLAVNKEKPVDTLLVNGAECEPYLTADFRLMLEATQAVILGGILAARAVTAPEKKIQVLFCIEDNKPEAIQALTEALVSMKHELTGSDVRVCVLRTKYPQGGEKQLIYAALKRKVPAGGLPMDAGVAVVNVGTAVSISHAVLKGQPLTHRVVTVTGGGITRCANLLVPIGTSIRELINYCGGLTERAVRVLAGGPMMGFSLGSLDIPVTKGTSGITVLTSDELQHSKETNCVRCGRCVSVCPMNLIPTRLGMTSRYGNIELFEKYHPMLCVECGCCAYECPAGIPLVQLIRNGKIALQRSKAASK